MSGILYGQKCNNCGKKGHYAVACRFQKIKEIRQDESINQNEISNDNFFVNIIEKHELRKVMSCAALS